MSISNKQRISLYLDRKLVEEADRAMKKRGFRSRNEFFSSLAEDFLAEEILQENGKILNDKLAKAVADLSENNAKAISKGLFRYAVQLEMVMRMIAQLFDVKEDEVEGMRREAIKNVRRTRGKVRLDEIIEGYYN